MFVVIHKLFSIWFVFVVLFISGAGALVNVCQIALHKMEMKKQIKTQLKQNYPDENVKVFSANQLKSAEWEHSSEFYLLNEKYDVLNVIDSNEQKYFFCISDQREMELLEKSSKNHSNHEWMDELVKKINLKLNVFECRFGTNELQPLTELAHTSNYKSTSLDGLFKPPIEL